MAQATPRAYHFNAIVKFKRGVPPYPAVPVAVSPFDPGLILPKVKALAALWTFRLVLGPPQLYHLKGFWKSRRRCSSIRSRNGMSLAKAALAATSLWLFQRLAPLFPRLNGWSYVKQEFPLFKTTGPQLIML